MGHSEMTLAVAGMQAAQIKQRTRKLASGDWSDFPPAERLALQYAHKVTRSPSSITDRDVKGLTDVFGPHRTLDLIWHAAWGNYMTRIADAFQLPLEDGNPFAPPQDTRPGPVKP